MASEITNINGNNLTWGGMKSVSHPQNSSLGVKHRKKEKVSMWIDSNILWTTQGQKEKNDSDNQKNNNHATQLVMLYITTPRWN